MIGKTLGHYQITEKMVEGGMVWSIRPRTPPIKLLPEEFAPDAERPPASSVRRRVASLNHPDIAAIHGVEESGGKRFIMMELVEGQTLARERPPTGELISSENVSVERICEPVLLGIAREMTGGNRPAQIEEQDFWSQQGNGVAQRMYVQHYHRLRV